MSALRPVREVFPTRSARWVADNCRAGRIPRAVKVGKTWFLPEGVDLSAPEASDVVDALTDMRAMMERGS